ncbi:DUF6249 domain-containing protein [Archangium sp.]|uniref:DUF6249 domain-containing protein n=1 Tax=Archangium sp. TaxID=1872627 RepID=UPI00389AD661
MKCQILTVCLLASLAGAGAARAESTPTTATTPTTPTTPTTATTPTTPTRPDLEARRQALESRQKELEAEYQRLAAEMEAQAKQMDPEARLTNEQLFELLQTREARLANGNDFDPTPIAISIVFFSSMLTGFLGWLFASYRKGRQLHETVRLMVEKGAEIPQGLLAPSPKRKPSDLRRGIILSTSGLGLAIFLAVVPDTNGAWGAGLTLLLIGVGHLLVWRLQQGRGVLSRELSPEPQP